MENKSNVEGRSKSLWNSEWSPMQAVWDSYNVHSIKSINVCWRLLTKLNQPNMLTYRLSMFLEWGRWGTDKEIHSNEYRHVCHPSWQVHLNQTHLLFHFILFLSPYPHQPAITAECCVHTRVRGMSLAHSSHIDYNSYLECISGWKWAWCGEILGHIKCI